MTPSLNSDLCFDDWLVSDKLVWICSQCTSLHGTCCHSHGICELHPTHHACFAITLQYGDLRTLKPWDDRLFPDSNGSIIAVSYEARRQGVKRCAHALSRLEDTAYAA
eukprot:GHRR01029064.1.p1 GENE.GHRR01029064.1~~GHRR01029064.1.p1  ORF type:complete len:108 (+),score=22.21 GHRR01029064.1:439-762(+)